MPRNAEIEIDLPINSRSLIEASRTLGSTRWASFARASCIPYLFNGMEQVFDSNREPIAGVNDLFDKLTSFLTAAGKSEVNLIGPSGTPETNSSRREKDGESSRPAIESATGDHYGRLFQSFSSSSFWDEPVALLRARLERNGIDPARLREQEALDAGCGGGRYTVALRLLGAKCVVGIDISQIGIAGARRRIDDAGVSGVVFQQGSVLDLPFEDNSFDVVFSNGVLHHTVDWRRGVSEIVRVLRPGGMGWLYLIEKPGGLFWALIEVMRELMKDEDRERARTFLQMLGLPDNRIFYILDHVMAPINIRLTPREIENCLAASGATQIRRLTRGADFDRVERIHRKEPFAELKYGVGENRYIFSKGSFVTRATP
jgi:SAM-dependent methyltransferase